MIKSGLGDVVVVAQRSAVFSSDRTGAATSIKRETMSQLPARFPNSVAQLSGLNVFYRVTFAYYDGSSATQTMTFQCTKSAPNPEFTFVE